MLKLSPLSFIGITTQGFVPGLLSFTSSLLCGVAAERWRVPGLPYEPPPLVRNDGGGPFQGQKDASDRTLLCEQKVTRVSSVMPRALHTKVGTPQTFGEQKKAINSNASSGTAGIRCHSTSNTQPAAAAALLSLIGFDRKRFCD